MLAQRERADRRPGFAETRRSPFSPRRRSRSSGSAFSRPVVGQHDQRDRGYLQAPWIVLGPGLALFVTVVRLNSMGDAVRDTLDPASASERGLPP